MLLLLSFRNCWNW